MDSEGNKMIYTEMVMSFNDRKLSLSGERGSIDVAIVAPAYENLASEIVKRWNEGINVCISCRFDSNNCPARPSGGDFAYALACVWHKPKLKLIKG
jgi:hypothetical protein